MVNSIVGTSAAASRKPEGHSVLFNLSLITVGLAVGGLALAYGIDALGRARASSAASGVVSRTLGSTELLIPAPLLAAIDDQPSGGFAKQVDLVLNLPLGPDSALRKVDVTLTQRSRVRPSASLLDGVYLHQFMPEQLNGPPGLVGKPLSPAAGYENETVWYDPLAPSPFVAKCQAPIVEGEAGHCLRAVYLGPGIAAVYGFDDDLLGNWRKFDAELHPILSKIGAL